MSRRGGLLGVAARGARALAEATGEEVLPRGTSDALVEAQGNVSLLARLANRLEAMQGQNQRQTQDEAPDDRLLIASKVRNASRRDSHVGYAVRLRAAFTFGRGAAPPKAADEGMQEVLDEFWADPDNKRALTTAQAQYAKARSLYTNANIYYAVFGLAPTELDGLVKLAGITHDTVVDVVRDPQNWPRVLYYKVREREETYDFANDRAVVSAKQRTFYYEALDGMAELEAEMERTGRAHPFPSMAVAGNPKLKPGRLLHLAINRGDEQAFGEPELRPSLQWAAGFTDMLRGQIEKAKSAQTYLMKVRAKGAATPNQLYDAAMAKVNRSSPLGNASLAASPDTDATGERRVGAEFWGNDQVDAESFVLPTGAAEAGQDMQSAMDAFATSTNYPGHYFHGDPGSLAGANAVELPVLKLTDMDQEHFESEVFRKVLDLQVQRAVVTGRVDPRRELTEEEVARGVEADADGLVARDLSYEFSLPDPLRRNLPEIMSNIVQVLAGFDPAGDKPTLQRALLTKALGEVLDFYDPTPIVEATFPEDEDDEEEQEHVDVTGGGAGGGSQGDGTVPGADGRRHPAGNAYGARRDSPSVEAATRLLERARDRADDLAAGGS